MILRCTPFNMLMEVYYLKNICALSIACDIIKYMQHMNTVNDPACDKIPMFNYNF